MGVAVVLYVKDLERMGSVYRRWSRLERRGRNRRSGIGPPRERSDQGCEGRVSVNRLKVPQRPDDISRVNPIDEESSEVQRLRTVHRCGMCQKRCLIPCKFTGDEFRQLVAGLTPPGEGPSSSA